MPDQTPSLSEITNMAVDPERGSGTPAVVIDTSRVAEAAMRAGQIKQENDWRKYVTFQNNLKDLYKDAKDIQSMEVAPQDRDELQKKVGNVFKKLGDNPRAYFGGGPQMTEIQKELGEIRSHATQSKQDQIYDMAHREFLTRNPGWATEQNRKSVDSFLNQPLGKRKPFLFEPAPVLDFDAMANSLNTQVGKNFSDTGFTGVDAQGNKVPGSNYIYKEKGKEYPTDKYMSLAEQSYDYQGDYGIKNRQAAENLFKQLPEETQKAYGNAKNWYITQLAARHKEREVSDTNLTPNRFAEMTQKQKFDYGMEAYRQGNREKLAQFKHGLSMEGAPANINFLLRQYASIAGNKTGKKINVQIDHDTNKYEEEDILNVSPDVLKKFASGNKTTEKTGTTGETETTTISSEPDMITRTKNGDLRAIYHQRYTKADEDAEPSRIPAGKKVGDIVVTKEGSTIFTHDNVIPKRQVMGLLGKDFVEKKMIGTSVDAADDILKRQGDNVSQFIDKVNSGEEDENENDQDEEDAEQSGSVSGSPIKSSHKAKGRVFKYKGEAFTESQVQKAAKQSGMNVEEYKKRIGVK